MFAITPFSTGRRITPAAHHRAVRELDDFFDRLFWAPDLAGSRNFREFDLYEKDGKLFLSIEAPGVEPDDLEIRVSKDRVAIKCSKESEEKEDEGATWYNRKASCGFNYEIALPFEIDTDAAEAEFERGVIRIAAPKLERSASKILSLKKAGDQDAGQPQ